MAELRWILLGVGALFCLGLWAWETRRRRQAADHEGGGDARGLFARWGSGRKSQSSAFDDDAADELDDQAFIEEIEDDSVHFDSQQALPLPEAAERSSGRKEPSFGEDAWLEATGDTQRLPALDPEAPPPPPPPAEEKIVTLRLIANSPGRFDGEALVEALKSAGLEHGKFSIFHRNAPDGRLLFSVANLMKPGTFDLHDVQGRQFSGIALFAVLEPENDIASAGPDAVDVMLSTAKQLARQLDGSLQDERGTPLTLQRLASLRAEIAHWRRQPS